MAYIKKNNKIKKTQPIKKDIIKNIENKIEKIEIKEEIYIEDKIQEIEIKEEIYIEDKKYKSIKFLKPFGFFDEYEYNWFFNTNQIVKNPYVLHLIYNLKNCPFEILEE